MCYEWGESGAYKSLPGLAELDLDVLLKRLEECLPGKPHVEFFGGEPMLYRGIWKLLGVLGDAGCEVAFPTNGTTLARHAGRLVSANPTRIWVSLDGPREINDAQRGAGVYDRATRGIDAIDRLKHETGHPYPELGLIFVVTPDNHHTIQEFFLELDLSRLGAVSIELQSYVTAEQHRHYARVAHEKFGVTTTPSAAAYVRDPAVFANVDADAVLVRYTLSGDSNVDGKVDLTDFTFLAANFNKSSGATWLQGDYNYDGKVDLTDFTFLAANFNQSLPADGTSLGLSVPEPILLAPIALLLACGASRTRRRIPMRH